MKISENRLLRLASDFIRKPDLIQGNVKRYWCKNAKINKKITWHCARHSFATNIIFYGSDVNSASSLLGHSSLAYTQRYLRVANELKEKAVQNLPTINL
jgi:site-specific recombinase XerD